LRVKVGERSERIVARDPPAKGRYGVGGSSPTGERRLKGNRHRGDDGGVTGSFPLSGAIARLARKNAKSRSYALAATSRLRHGQDK
jgi:hypothetical protein